MAVRVVHEGPGHRLNGAGPITQVANRFLAHLQARGFAAGTVRGYAHDLLNLSRFLAERNLELGEVTAMDLFDWLAWQSRPRPTAGRTVVRLAEARGAAPATINRRVAAARGLFEYAVIVGLRPDSPAPGPRRSSGLRAPRQGLLGHVKPRRDGPRRGGQLVRQPCRLPESLDAGEVRRLRLANVDMGLRRLRVVGKGKPRTDRAGRPRILRRAGRASAPGAPGGADDHRVFRGAARPDPRPAAVRGEVAADLSHASCHRRRRAGASTPAASHLRHRVRPRPPGATMTAAVAAVTPLPAARTAVGLLVGYDAFVDTLPISSWQRSVRRHAARRFLAQHGDLVG